MIVFRSLTIIFLLLFIAACSPRCNQFKAILDQVLRNNTHASVKLFNCRASGRDGRCMAGLDITRAEDIANKMGLAVVPAGHEQRRLLSALSSWRHSCSHAMEESDLRRVWFVHGRPDFLRLSESVAFEYLLLVVDIEERVACFQSSYSYS